MSAGAGSHSLVAADDRHTAMVDIVHADLVAEAPDGVRCDRGTIIAEVRRRWPLAEGSVVESVADRLVARSDGLGPLAPLLDDAEISDVLVNGPGFVWVERRGQLERTEIWLQSDEIHRLLERIVAPLGLRVDRASPLVDARLPDGSRVNAVVPPLAVDGPVIAIRRFGVVTRPLASMCAPGVAALLAWAVRTRRNVLVSGGTGSGKTTLLNALAAEIPASERLITVEDVAELQLRHPHAVRLEARPANTDGVGAVSIRRLVRNALRLRPDRIIVGEVRGAEAIDMLQAMNTGHEGALSTCHANGPADALRRLETMIVLEGDLPLVAVREQIAAAVDVVVQVARVSSGERRVVAVAEPGVLLDATGRLEVRSLARLDDVVALPERLARTDGDGPDPAWLAGS